LEALWHLARQTIDSTLDKEPAAKTPQPLDWDEEFLVLVKCRDERQQIQLLERFMGEELECKALMSLRRTAAASERFLI